MLLVIAATMIGGCFSRNVESLSEEDDAAPAASSAPAPARAPEQQAAPAADEPSIAVTVTVGDDVETVPQGVLYVIVRVAGRAGGPPLAVKRLPADLPAEFTVTSADAMIAGTPLVPSMDVTVRLDQDGDALSTQAGDLSGAVGSVGIGDAIQVVLSPAEAR